ncbi:MFS transporter [Aerococcaceae bacterium zg-BR9]|uniref:MFS transporter n=1 Tax=Aerococcaceae bacterium zg-1292 TaxID=2774330 RepID=UPI0040639543|nr:MFS transporter [Aerococcaceae bacterium zg-BR9]
MNAVLKRYYALSFIVVVIVSFFNPILYLFLLNSFSVQQIGTYYSLFWLISFLTEVPCGSITDVIGEKKSLYLSTIFRIIGLLLLMSNQYAVFLLSAIFSAISESFQSGTLNSWVINTLKKKGYEEVIDYDRLFSRAVIIGSVTSMVVGFVSSKYLYTYSAYLPIIFSIGACVVQWFIITMMTDYRENISDDYSRIKKESINELKSVGKGLLKAKMGLVLMLLIIIPSVIDIGPSNQWQAIFYEANNPSLTSYVWIVISICGIIGGYVSDKVLRNMRASRAFLVLIYINIALVLLMSLHLNMLMRITLFGVYIIMNAICGVKASTLLHKEIVEDDRFRNTTVSIFYSFDSMMMSMLLWVNGWASGMIGIENTWMWTAVLVALFVLIGYLVVFRKLD